MPHFAPPGAFARELRQQGLAYLRGNPHGRFATRAHWLRAWVWIGLTTVCAVGLLTSGGPVTFAWIVGTGLSAFFILATLAHDAAHGALSRRAWVNRLALTATFGLFGIAGHLWRWRHVRLHHMYPNVEGMDIDGEGSLIIRLAPHGPWRWWHRYQPLYAPLLYALVFPHLAWIDDWRHRAMARRMCPEQFANHSATAEFIAVKLAHVAATLVLPWLVLNPPLWALIAGYLLFMGVPSLLFIVIVAGSHLSDEVEFVSPDKDTIPHDWAEHQVLTSLDWAPEHPLAVIFSGGSNAHTAHHLFPEAAHSHNARLSRLVSDTTRKHHIHHNVTSFSGMVASHFGHLKELGRRPHLPLS